MDVLCNMILFVIRIAISSCYKSVYTPVSSISLSYTSAITEIILDDKL